METHIRLHLEAKLIELEIKFSTIRSLIDNTTTYTDIDYKNQLYVERDITAGMIYKIKYDLLK